MLCRCATLQLGSACSRNAALGCSSARSRQHSRALGSSAVPQRGNPILRESQSRARLHRVVSGAGGIHARAVRQP